MKDRAYLLKTHIGPFLLNRYKDRWESDFQKFAGVFFNHLHSYLKQNYDLLRKNALSKLERLLEVFVQKSRKNKQILAIVDSLDFAAYARKVHSEIFPSIDQLMASCSAKFIRFGMHPDLLQDEDLMQVLLPISSQADLV